VCWSRLSLTSPEAHQASCTMGTGSSFPGEKWPGQCSDTPPSSVVEVRMFRAILLPLLCAFVACGELYLLHTILECECNMLCFHYGLIPHTDAVLKFMWY
jgi:hypothetical protein